MKFSRVSLFFLAILLLSLALKIGFKQDRGPVDYAAAERELVGLLDERGYDVSVERRSWSPIVKGQKAGCNLLITVRDPDGSTLNRIAELAQPVGKLQYIYRSAISAEPPVLDPMIRGRIVRQLRQFGFRAGRSPVLAVAASKPCNLKEFNWSRLASMP